MPGYFDFLAQVPRYAEEAAAVDRLNKRHAMILAPRAPEIAGARVLDLGAYDGRWCHAYAAAGAREVVGIEGRAELAAQYEAFPEPALKAKVTLEVGDLFGAMEARVQAGERFDVVSLLGIFHHVMEHFRLLRLVSQMQPRLVILDGEVALRPGPTITLLKEATDKSDNALPQIPGQEVAVVGVPSQAAVEVMAEALGLRAEWLDWEMLKGDARKGLSDYYRAERKRRGTCLLRPV